ncbi:hypothetical protein Poli38472_012517 [Pythium oligandrum]|uniref:Carrier domain-containing protein n=1 Tax=Pythium oligandrum TaxID=41045 RepID=A0A8K1CDD0_PYTOL|nr:hypothetical protein Poli38472_012517 [Pythium oligandrum]|eukprot:TMW61326.1 hypothetical protein Poli38472_012517 [Pythium oligandrum]
METLLAGVGVEVAAAASLAAVSVAAVVLSRKRTRQDVEEEEGEAETVTTTTTTTVTTQTVKIVSAASSPVRKKQRQSIRTTGVATLDSDVDEHGVLQEVVVKQLQRYAESPKYRHKIVYTFLDDQGKETVNYTFAEVDEAARRIAATLQRDANVKKGDRVMLCYPPGLDFALAFWGCLYAGAVGIPVYPPYPGTLAKDLPKFNRMVEDSGARVILTNRTYHLASKMATVKGFFSIGSNKAAATTWPENVQWITTDSIADSVAELYDEAAGVDALTMDDIAFFQYSSGSTSAPKAVMISHRNLRAQLKTWESIESEDTLISWLPSYHDMGLVGFIITPCIFAARCVSMSPISFIKDPAMWMRIVTKYKGTHVCAPNFGYALAARKTTDEQAKKMDLSTIKQAICAAEPIRVESLEAFTSKFEKSANFNPKTFNCGYGLAEVTLVCTGQNPLERKDPTVLHVDKTTLEAEKRVKIVKQQAKSTGVMTLVGCGKAMPTFSVIIVDPDSKKKLQEGHVGEVWIQGPSVAAGYWNREEYTKEMFGALLHGEKNDANVYLRTGDMGFLKSGELFVTGRLKDLIIVRGRNVCPQDVEATVENAHDNVRPGCVAAFSIEKNEEEALVVVSEVKNGTSKDVCIEICREITKSVLAEHQLRCESIVLLRQKTIPKTTSGKIQRSAAKSKFLTKLFTKPLYEFTSKDKSPLPAPVRPQTKPDNSVPAETAPKQQGPVKTPEEILAWLLERIAQEVAMEVEPETEDGAVATQSKSAEQPNVDPHTPWASYGLDSVAIVGLSSELGEFLGCVVPPSAFFQFDTPERLANAPGLATGELEMTGDDDDAVGSNVQTIEEIDASCYDIASFSEVQKLFGQMKEIENAGLRVPYLETLTPEKRQMVNFNTYNYLGNASNQEVATGAKKAIEEYGTTMSSSPIVGQTQVAVDLEAELCSFFQAEAAVMFVGGWVTNVTTIDALVSKGDLILCDALNHDSCVTGQRLSGATILPFPHNDTQALERMLSKIRTRYRRVLIVIEGVYSMDGDIPDLKEMVRIKQQYKCMLFLDEAHSFGTMGKTGRGLCEHAGVDPKDVDVRMGTMSKALGSVGGFILGSEALAKYLKHCAGGFVFSVGLSPAHCGAALKSLQLMSKSASRTLKLQERSSYFFDLCKKANLPVGSTTFRGAPVVVVIVGSTIATAMASQYLAEKGQVNVKPIVHPAVEEGKCRLRFFISALHTKKQLEHSVAILAEYLKDPQAAMQALIPAALPIATPASTAQEKAPAQKSPAKKHVESPVAPPVVSVTVKSSITASTKSATKSTKTTKQSKTSKRKISSPVRRKSTSPVRSRSPPAAHDHHHNHNNGNHHSHSAL